MAEGKDVLEGVSTPAPPLDEPVFEPAESKPTELADDVPPFDEGAFSRAPEPTTAEPIIADLDAAKEVEPHAAELEIAPDPIETIAVVGGFVLWAYSWLTSTYSPRKIPRMYPKCRPMLKNPSLNLTLPRPLSSR